ncbi:MAG: hypothetical protein ACRDQH_11490 [Pseudonocardiaceae bacterium]
MILLLPAAFSDATALTGVALAPPPTPAPDPGGQGEDYGKAAPVALVVLLLFFVAVALLVRSMNKHLRRVPPSFDRDPDRNDPDTGASPREE